MSSYQNWARKALLSAGWTISRIEMLGCIRMVYWLPPIETGCICFGDGLFGMECEIHPIRKIRKHYPQRVAIQMLREGRV